MQNMTITIYKIFGSSNSKEQNSIFRIRLSTNHALHLVEIYVIKHCPLCSSLMTIGQNTLFL